MLNEGGFMVDLDSVFCPKCNVGFAPDTRICPICKIPLTSEADFGDEPKEASEPMILDDDLSSLKELRTADVGWVYHLQDKLAEAGIPHRIELSDAPHRFFSVYVRPEDLGRAKDIDDEVFTIEVPESEGTPHLEDLDFSSCPGCGNRLGEKDLKCSSCGLVLFPTEGWRCSKCDEEVEFKVAVCPHCGRGIDWSEM
jgi:hypothetical protein